MEVTLILLNTLKKVIVLCGQYGLLYQYMKEQIVLKNVLNTKYQSINQSCACYNNNVFRLWNMMKLRILFVDFCSELLLLMLSVISLSL